MSKEIAKKSETAVGQVMPEGELLSFMATEAGNGTEGISAADVAIPYLTVLQALSPQLRGVGKIEGAKEGQFFNSVTGEVLDGPIHLIPCHHEKAWVEWKPRESGGGFVARHNTDEILKGARKNEKGQDVMVATGHIIEPTMYFYCLNLKKDESTERVLVALKSTQLKHGRKWNSVLTTLQLRDSHGKLFNAPTYSHKYTVSSFVEHNDKNSWMSWNFSEPKVLSNIETYAAGRKFYQACQKGEVKVAEPVSDSAVSEPEISSEI